MEYQVLARKLRPKSFDQVIGQDHIVRSLKNSLKNKSVAHAYLLTGTRGVGKTTIARIFAKSLMCPNKTDDVEACQQCSTCKSIDNTSSLDYLEIDGASNNGVENIRQLIDNVQYLPTQGDYKVYVIDEVHMLSNSAFNALLKTLEEPPKHAVFIFATTDPHKLLGTVLSRCQRFDFKSVGMNTLTEYLKKVSRDEGIQFESEKFYEQLCHYAKGSVRDLLSLLDQVLSFSIDKKVDEQVFTQSLGIARFSMVNELIRSIILGDKETINKTYDSIIELNVDLEIFANQVLDQLFNLTQNIDNTQMIKSEFKLDDEVITNLSMSELFWIFETYTKDVTWALSSMAPMKVMKLALQKITLRRELLKPGADRLVKKNSSEPVAQKEELSEEDLVEKPVKETISPEWERLLTAIGKKHSALKVNLEHGNLIEYVKRDEDLFVKIGFKRNAMVFFEFIGQPENKQVLLSFISEFESIEHEHIRFEIQMIGDEIAEDINFKSKVEIEMENEKKEEEYLKEKFLKNKYILEAQKIFDSEVDKVVIDKKDSK